MIKGKLTITQKMALPVILWLIGYDRKFGSGKSFVTLYAYLLMSKYSGDIVFPQELGGLYENRFMHWNYFMHLAPSIVRDFFPKYNLIIKRTVMGMRLVPKD